MKRFLVTTVYSNTLEVIANDKRGARLKALQMVSSFFPGDWPYRVEEVAKH